MASVNDKRRRELRQMMKSRGWTAADVAVIVARQPQTVRTWLCGTRKLPEYAMRLLTPATRRG